MLAYLSVESVASGSGRGRLVCHAAKNVSVNFLCKASMVFSMICFSLFATVQYNSSQSTATLPEASKNITYSKYVSSIQRSLLNNNYQRRSEERKIFPTLKKDISGVHRTPGGQEQLTWIPSNCI